MGKLHLCHKVYFSSVVQYADEICIEYVDVLILS